MVKARASPHRTSGMLFSGNVSSRPTSRQAGAADRRDWYHIGSFLIVPGREQATCISEKQVMYRMVASEICRFAHTVGTANYNYDKP
jgi:hypothetical protein